MDFKLLCTNLFSALVITNCLYGDDTALKFPNPETIDSYTTELPKHRNSASLSATYDLSQIVDGVHPIIKNYSPATPFYTQTFMENRKAGGKPVTTHKFWSSIPWKFYRGGLDGAGNQIDDTFVRYSQVLFNQPFIMQLKRDGLSLVYTNTQNLSPVTSIRPENMGEVLMTEDDPQMLGYSQNNANPELGFHIEGFKPIVEGACPITGCAPGDETRVDSYGDWSVTTFWGDSSSAESEKTDYLKATFGYGLPYVYLEKQGLGDVIFDIPKSTRIWLEKDGAIGLIVTETRHNYMIFAPKEATWEYEFSKDDPNRTLTSLKLKLKPEDKYFSIAALPEEFNKLIKVKSDKLEPAQNFTVDKGSSLESIPLYVEGEQTVIGATLIYQDFFRNFGGYFQSKFGGYDKASLDAAGIQNYEIPELISAADLFRKHAFAFPVDTKISWDWDQETNKVNTTYSIVTEQKYPGDPDYSSQPLMALFPHQWKNSSVSFPLDYSYKSPRGQMKLIEGSQFSTSLEFPGVIPNLPNMLTQEEKTELNSYLDKVVDEKNIEAPPFLFPGVSTTYISGKYLGRLAHLVPIAKQEGREAQAQEYLNIIKNALNDWFDASDYTEDKDNGTLRRYFYYDKDWNTLIGYPADFGADTDLNDHHFHYGYFIMAAATVARYDKEWGENHREMVNLLIKDAANWDRKDQQFPFMRNFDPYLGYSQASGHAGFADGQNQESSSESMNFATAVVLWGTEMKDPEILKLGAFLYTTESESIRQYWYDVDGTNFPKDVWYHQIKDGDKWVKHSYNQPAVGMVWNGKADFSTWFAWAPQKIYGINFLPISGGSLYQARMPNKINEIMEKLPFTNELYYLRGDPDPTFLAGRMAWSDIIWEENALIDPGKSVDAFNKNKDYPWEGAFLPQDPDNPPVMGEKGESKAHTYHWIFNLYRLGNLRTDITANASNYAVFEQNGSVFYVVYNPLESAKTVNFSDGTQVESAAKSLQVFDKNKTAIVTELNK